jgi:hypothetical protein
MTNKLLLTAIMPVIAAAILGSALLVTTTNANNMQSGPSLDLQSQQQTASAIPQIACITSLSQVSAKFPVKEPAATALPASYKLQAIEEFPNTVVMFYTDHSVCPDTSIGSQEAKGTVVVMAGPIDWANNSTDLQEKALKAYAQRSDVIAKVQPLEVNGFKGFGWEPFQGRDTVRLNGTIIHDEPTPMPGHVAWYNDNDHLGYSVWGIQPLAKLLEIARSIPT